MLKVKDAMTKEVIYLYEDNTIDDALRLFGEIPFHAIPIVKKESMEPIQIITTRDIPKIFSLILKDNTIKSLLEGLNKKPQNLITIKKNANLKSALYLMDKYNISHLPVIDDEKKLIGILSAKDLIKQFALLTFTDELTKAFTRKYLDLIQNKIKGKSNVCLLMIDIDNFKKLNDTYGHLVGDLVLKRVAQSINQVIRTSDVLIRYGGEEFLVILIRCFREKLFDVSERIRNSIKNIIFKKYPQLRVTVSIGGYYLNPEEDLFKGIEKADLALYKAKNSGKDCIVIFEA